MNYRTATLVVALIAGTAANAQSPPIPLPAPPAGATPGQSMLAASAANVGQGQRIQVAIHAQSATAAHLHFGVFWDASLFTMVGWTPGGAMLAYAAAADNCDVFVYPSAAGSATADTVFYDEVFSSAQYGTEVLVLEFEAAAVAPCSASVLLMDGWGQVDQAQLSIVEADPVRMGDTNGDSLVNVVDAVLLLQAISGPHSLPCARAADLDASDSLSLVDALLLLNTLFGTQPPLQSDCVTEPTALECTMSGC